MELGKLENYINKIEIFKTENKPFEKLKALLTNEINYLINTNFSHLVFVLYKLDINETKLENALKFNNENSANLIAAFIIERQLQKIESRKNFKINTNGINENELL